VLDTAHGRPAAALAVRVARWNGTEYAGVRALVTNADGRCDAPLLEGADLTRGRYRLTFSVGAYYAAQGVTLPDPPFLDEVTIDFGVPDASAHYHVPLLVSPFGYTTYRGS
jgi:5-hydroxyisourate hydrolase